MLKKTFTQFSSQSPKPISPITSVCQTERLCEPLCRDKKSELWITLKRTRERSCCARQTKLIIL